MNRISLDAASRTVTVGAGTSLGDIYKFIGPRGFALAAGSCPTVGIAGHSLGGGYGPPGAPVRPDLRQPAVGRSRRPASTDHHCDQKQNSDLFWACRGGGGGTFGAAVSFRFRVQPLRRVVVFSLSFALAPDRAAKVFKAWQRWAPHAPDAITSILKVNKRPDQKIGLHCAGQSVGPMRGGGQRIKDAPRRRGAGAAAGHPCPIVPAGGRSLFRRLELRIEVLEGKIRFHFVAARR